MTDHMLIFGMGYTATRLARTLVADGWQVTSVRRIADGVSLGMDDDDAIIDALGRATHILSSAPPTPEEGDPVLALYEDSIKASGAGWIGYLSSTGVYGDTGGAWVDETAPIGQGRRAARAQADIAWQALHEDVRVFRLPGIYGPGRSALDRVRDGKAHRIDAPDQIFSRIHVDDIVAAVRASFDAPPGIYNISDDRPASQNAVIEYACDLMGLRHPSLQLLEQAELSPMGKAFYAENRRVSNGKGKRLLRWFPQFSDYKQGLDEIFNQMIEKGD